MDFEYVQYMIKENDKIVKYGIKYDENTLQRLRREICHKCGIRTHHVEETAGRLYYEDILVENLKSKFKYSKEYDYGYCNYYELDYNLIEEPYLSKIIKEFIKGDIINLVLLIHYDILKDEKTNFDLENKRLKKILNLCIEKNDTYKLEQISKKIKNNLDNKKINEKLNLCDQKDYVLKLKSLLVVDKIDEMDYEEYKKFLSFTKKMKIMEIIK